MRKTDETLGLITIEKRAETVYRRAKVLFESDPALAALLGELAADEESHYRLLMELREGAGVVMLIPGDTRAQGATEAALAWFEHRVSSGIIGKAEMMEAVAALEFSEHNEMFIYMVNAIRGFPEEFSGLLALLAAHRERITGFLAGKEEFSRALALTRQIPELTKSRDILIVEDEAPISGLLRVFLAEEGRVHQASNGREALSMLEERNYSAVISDIEMPVMNGIEFYLKAEERFRGIGQKFLFLTGSFEEEYLHFFRTTKAKHLLKPVSMGEVKKALSSIFEE